MISLTISSIILDIICGIIFCLPKKYPLNIDDIDINGNTNPMDFKPTIVLFSCNRYVPIYLDVISNISIINRLIISDIGIIDSTKFLLLDLSSATSLLIAIGNPNCAIVISSINVGVISIYIPSVYVPTSLFVTIFMIIPNILVINPPITSIIVDFRNEFFIYSPRKLYVKKIYKYFGYSIFCYIIIVVRFMEQEFKSLRELYDRVTPALRSKRIELNKIGYKEIKESDIWNYLTSKKWKNSINLSLSELVNDIFESSGEEIVNYMILKLSKEMREPHFDE